VSDLAARVRWEDSSFHTCIRQIRLWQIERQQNSVAVADLRTWTCSTVAKGGNTSEEPRRAGDATRRPCSHTRILPTKPTQPLTRSFNLLEQDSVWDIQLEANVSGSGWLGIGWSSNGKMQVRAAFHWWQTLQLPVAALRCVHLHVQATSRASRDASTTVPSCPRPSLVQWSHPRATSGRYHSQPLRLCIGKQPSQQTRIISHFRLCAQQ
jgi:hypothetical protein